MAVDVTPCVSTCDVVAGYTDLARSVEPPALTNHPDQTRICLPFGNIVSLEKLNHQAPYPPFESQASRTRASRLGVLPSMEVIRGKTVPFFSPLRFVAQENGLMG